MQSMAVILDQIEVPETGVVRVQVDEAAEVWVSAEAARKIARCGVSRQVTKSAVSRRFCVLSDKESEEFRGFPWDCACP